MNIKIASFMLALAALSGVAHADTIATTEQQRGTMSTTTPGLPNTGSSNYTDGRYYYFHNSATGQTTVSAQPTADGTNNPTTAVNVTNPNANYTQGSYYYYYDNTGTLQTSPTLPNTGGSGTVTSGTTNTTPGLPNTGAGGDATTTIALLTLGTLAIVYAGYRLVRE